MSTTEGWIVCMGSRGPELARASEFEDATDSSAEEEGRRIDRASEQREVGELERRRRHLQEYVNRWPVSTIENPTTNERQAMQKITDWMSHWNTDRGYEESFSFFEMLMESTTRSYEYWRTLPDPTRGRSWPAGRKRRLFRTNAMKYGLRSALERQLGCGNGASPEVLETRQNRIKGFLTQLAKAADVSPP